MSDDAATPTPLPAIGRPVRLLMGDDMALEIEPATVITLIASNLPAFLQVGAEELGPSDAALRFGAKQAVRGLLSLMNRGLAAQGWPAEARPIPPRNADVIEYGLSYLVWFGLLQAARNDWTATYVETDDGARITGVAPAPARDVIGAGPADDAAAAAIAGDPAPAQLVAETTGDAHQ